jgi:hypothetical protein
MKKKIQDSRGNFAFTTTPMLTQKTHITERTISNLSVRDEL